MKLEVQHRPDLDGISLHDGSGLRVAFIEYDGNVMRATAYAHLFAEIPALAAATRKAVQVLQSGKKRAAQSAVLTLSPVLDQVEQLIAQIGGSK